MRSFDVRIPAGKVSACLVRVGSGATRHLPQDLARRRVSRRIVVVSDARVARLHGSTLAKQLERAGFRAHVLTFPPGERSKTRETKAALEDRLFDLGVGRDATVVAVGGGVTGDLAGFLAATWHRGLPIVQVPTTLLAMVDSSLGGKTGVDLPHGKNLVGAFLQPLALYADVDLLATLPSKHLHLGFAEVVKTAAIADAAFFSWLERNQAGLLAARPRLLETAIDRCLRIKGRIVAGDERESGRRAILNFGHTVAHAIEAASDYAVPHGKAVAIGLVVESQLAVRALSFPREGVRRVADLLASLGVGAKWPAGVDAEKVVEATRRDKKVLAGEVHFSLPTRIGRMLPGPSVTVRVSETELGTAIAETVRAARV